MNPCYLSRTTASVVLGRVQLPAAVPVLYSIGQEAWQAAIHLAGRVAADMTVLQNHMSKVCGRMGVANAVLGLGSENAILGRRQIVQIHRQTSRLQGDAFFLCFEGEEIGLGRSLRAFGGDS